MNPLWNPPAYLIAVPQVVSASSEYSDDETSDGEEGDGTFNAEEFKRPPFEINWTKRGEVTENDRLSSSCESDYESEFIKKIENESFGKNVAQVEKRVAVVIGHNRMRSLSNSVNRFLVEKSKQCANSSILSREIHFFWRPQWKNITTGEEVEWETVRKFYCQLKYRDRQNARLFRKESEGITLATKRALKLFYESYKETKIKSKEFFEKQPAISHFTQRHIQVFEKMLKKKTVSKVKGYKKLLRKARIIPYREIREEIKDHLQTRKCIQILRKRTKGPIYMAFQDGDVKSMEELFSNYDIALQAHLNEYKRLPDVVSGGYKINEPHNPILEIGVRIDLWVRHFTAKVFPIGVYYPEPNTLVQVKEGDSLLEASFVDKRDYSSPKEMPTLIADLIKKRKIKHLKRSFLFDARAALTTATPKRMKRCFKAFYTNQNKIVRWGLSDLTIYKGIAQTHYSNRSWAINLCDAIGVPKQIVYKDITIRKKELRELVISLVARLFSTYDPFEVARRTFLDAKGKKMGFQKTMISVLSNYVPDELPLPPKKQINREHKGRLNKIWEEIDAIKRKEKLCATIDDFLEKPGTGHKIQTAAQSSMKKVVKIFRKNLSFNFIELSIAAMMSLEKPRDVKGQSRHTIIALRDIGSPLHQKVLEMVEIDSKEKPEFKKKAKELPEAERQGYLETYPMHWAAITGNVEAVRFLKSLNSWISITSQPGTKGLLPLHCAIRYCADNGNDLALIREFATNRLDLTDWKASDALRESPLAMVLNELDDPYPVLKILSEHPILAPANREALLTVLREFKQAKYQKSMLKFLIDHVPAEEKSSLIKELHQQGVIFDEDMLSKAVKKILNQETFDGELCLTLIKCSRNNDDWYLFQLPCGHTFLEHVLDTDHHDAANFLVDHFRDFDALSPVETQKLRELTGNKTVMCEEDRESNERNAIRRAVKHCAIELGDQEGLEYPQVRKEFFKHYVEDLIENGSLALHDYVNSEYESYDTSSYGDSLEEDSSDDSASDDSASNPKSSLSEDFSLSLSEFSSDIEGCVGENESEDGEVEGYESHSSGEDSSRSFRSEDSSQSSPSRDYSGSSPSRDSSDSPVLEYSLRKRKGVF